MSNPLLEMLRSQSLPPFSQIRPEHAEPALDAVLAANRQVIAELEQLDSPEVLILPLSQSKHAV